MGDVVFGRTRKQFWADKETERAMVKFINHKLKLKPNFKISKSNFKISLRISSFTWKTNEHSGLKFLEADH